ncbi:MAG: glycosyltransferase family 4 protein [Syntrophales bacterium]|jgi:glycosyltransferase involved in cell wall biosynthesis
MFESLINIAGNLYGRLHRPYTCLFFKSDYAGWVLDWEMREIMVIASKIGIRVGHSRWTSGVRRQAIFYANQFELFDKMALKAKGNRLGFAYFHGRSFELDDEFRRTYQLFCDNHQSIHRIQVSNTGFRDFLLESGVSPDKVFVIPIGVNLRFFRYQTRESRLNLRRKYGIPLSAVVVGSFQKDGVGWNEGNQPKFIKGPDVFLKVIDILRKMIPELFIVLSGPARGYVKNGLERMKVPYVHYMLKEYPEVGELFQTLDVYMVTSREEGGPKAILESMASGIPLVTTRVGQAVDLVKHGKNGWMVDVEDFEGLAHWTYHAIDNSEGRKSILDFARSTAEHNSYDAQQELWRRFMNGFVEIVA